MIVIEFILKDSIEELNAIVAKVEDIREAMRSMGRFELADHLSKARHKLRECISEIEGNLRKLNNQNNK